MTGNFKKMSHAFKLVEFVSNIFVCSGQLLLALVQLLLRVDLCFLVNTVGWADLFSKSHRGTIIHVPSLNAAIA